MLFKHIDNVLDCIFLLTDMLRERAYMHDQSKIDNLTEFKQCLLNNKVINWNKNHDEERYHLDDNIPDDVNLLDVIQMICDYACLKADGRYKVPKFNISSFTLQEAVKNTILLLENMLHVKLSNKNND